MSERDPILDAVQKGNDRCPDGRALARLGEEVRARVRVEGVDLHDRVLAACQAAAEADDTVGEDPALIIENLGNGDEHVAEERIDAFYDTAHFDPDEAPDEELDRLRGLIREAARPEREPDLLPAIEERLAAASGRHGTGVDPSTRWRIITAVVGFHVAALLALTTLKVTIGNDRVGDGTIPWANTHYVIDPSDLREKLGEVRGENTLDYRLPADWGELSDRPMDLYLLRADRRFRGFARDHYRAANTTVTVDHALVWLASRQIDDPGRDDGRIGDRQRGDTYDDLATHALALLALMGEGLDESEREQVVRRGMVWLLNQQHQDGSFGHRARDRRVYGVLCNALVEGAMLLDDGAYRHAAERAFVAHRPALSGSPGGGGFGGFALLAVETAELGDIALPDGMLQEVRRAADRVTPSPDDLGSRGLVAFAHQIRDGVEDPASLAHLAGVLDRLERHGPRPDPIGWFFASLAVRELGGTEWAEWNAILEQRILPCFDYEDGKAWVEPGRVPYAPALGPSGDVFATAICTLDFQVAYRFLPLAGTDK